MSPPASDELDSELIDADKKDGGGRQVRAMTYPSSDGDDESRQIEGRLVVLPMTSFDDELLGYSYSIDGWSVMMDSIQEITPGSTGSSA